MILIGSLTSTTNQMCGRHVSEFVFENEETLHIRKYGDTGSLHLTHPVSEDDQIQIFLSAWSGALVGETDSPRGRPHRHGGSMQTPHRMALLTWELNPGPSWNHLICFTPLKHVCNAFMIRVFPSFVTSVPPCWHHHPSREPVPVDQHLEDGVATRFVVATFLAPGACFLILRWHKARPHSVFWHSPTCGELRPMRKRQADGFGRSEALANDRDVPLRAARLSVGVSLHFPLTVLLRVKSKGLPTVFSFTSFH